jgi:hypothetical protein
MLDKLSCNFCDKEIFFNSIGADKAYKCDFCGKIFCGEHIDMDNHKCNRTNHEITKPSEQNAKWYDSKLAILIIAFLLGPVLGVILGYFIIDKNDPKKDKIIKKIFLWGIGLYVLSIVGIFLIAFTLSSLGIYTIG